MTNESLELKLVADVGLLGLLYVKEHAATLDEKEGGVAAWGHHVSFARRRTSYAAKMTPCGLVIVYRRLIYCEAPDRPCPG